MIEAAVFWSLAGVTLVGALGVALLRNVLHAALMLGLCLLGVAGLFASLGADFLFAAQVLVYVGGVAVLVLFVVLLAGRASDLLTRQTNHQWLPGALLAGLTCWGLLRSTEPVGGGLAAAPPSPTTRALAGVLLGDLAVPFELVTLILLAALVGAVLFSKKEPEA